MIRAPQLPPALRGGGSLRTGRWSVPLSLPVHQLCKPPAGEGTLTAVVSVGPRAGCLLPVSPPWCRGCGRGEGTRRQSWPTPRGCPQHTAFPQQRSASARGGPAPFSCTRTGTLGAIIFSPYVDVDSGAMFSQSFPFMTPDHLLPGRRRMSFLFLTLEGHWVPHGVYPAR